VYVRIDMFVTATNEIYVQEYTFNHLGGTKHCAATIVDGCVDSCFLGKLWYGTSLTSDERAQGGPNKPRPPAFPQGYGTLSDAAQCTSALAMLPMAGSKAC
jgi:hypothetical protein